MALPGTLVPWLGPLATPDGLPAAGWQLHFVETGTSTDKDTYPTADLDIPNPNPVVLDAGGWPEVAIFLLTGGYDMEILDADDTLQKTFIQVEDVGRTFLSQLGVVLGTGSVGVTSGYTVLDTDQLVLVSSTGGSDPCVINLQPVGDRGLPLCIKNMGTVAIAVTPDGTDTIESIAGPYTIPAAASPLYPAITLNPDGENGMWITASHGIPTT